MTKTISIAAFLATVLAMPFLASAAVISIQLDPGMTNSDVSALQTFLAKDSTIYPEGIISGFFGPLTVAAVKRYQTANGIAPVGRVGPATLASINGTSVGDSSDLSAPITTSVNTTAGSNGTTVMWALNEPAYGRVMYATSWPFLYATAASVNSSNGFSSAQTATLGGLQRNTKYYYVLESTDAAGNLNWTIGNSFQTN